MRNKEVFFTRYDTNDCHLYSNEGSKTISANDNNSTVAANDNYFVQDAVAA